MKRRKWWLAGLSVLLILSVCGVAACLAVQRRVASAATAYIVDAETAPTCDAALVLGAQVYKSGTPSPVLQDRLDYAVRLYRAGKVPKILASGDHGTIEYDEVKGMLNYLLKQGVPRQDIFLDHAGFNTYDSMYRARDVFAVKKVLVCTQEFHMGRSLYIARSLGLEAWGVPAPDKAMYNMSYNDLRESLARVKAFLDTEVLHRKPRYLGEVIPIWGDGTVTDGKEKSGT